MGGLAQVAPNVPSGQHKSSPPEALPAPTVLPVTTRPSILSASASGASFLILLQLLSRLLTFAVNQLLLRYLSPELLGVSTQLELYSITVLFFARESLRIALQRQGNDASASEKHTKQDETHISGNGDTPPPEFASRTLDPSTPAGQTQTVINLAYIPLFLGIPISLGLADLYLRTSDPSVLLTPKFRLSLDIYTVACLLELLAEPVFILIQHQMQYKLRAGIESIATVGRCVTTCTTAVLASRAHLSVGVLPFAFGQLASAVLLLSLHLYYSLRLSLPSSSSLFPRPIKSYTLSLFSPALLSLASTLSLQSVLKHLLTQGDTLLITVLSPLTAQGTYALASNYGSLIARLIFQPIEESSRALFSRLLTSPTTAHHRRQALTTLSLLLHFYALLSLLIVSLLPTLFPLLLRLLTSSSRWEAAYPALAAYSYYIPLLAFNGLLEAFVSAVATETQLHAQSGAMVAFSVGFAGAGWVFLRLMGWGARGLVAANAVNMLLRIWWGVGFLRRWMAANGREGWEGVGVGWSTVGAVVAGGAAVKGLERGFEGGLGDVIRAGLVAAAEGGAVLWLERAYLTRCYALLRPKALPSEEQVASTRQRGEKS